MSKKHTLQWWNCQTFAVIPGTDTHTLHLQVIVTNDFTCSESHPNPCDTYMCMGAQKPFLATVQPLVFPADAATEVTCAPSLIHGYVHTNAVC